MLCKQILTTKLFKQSRPGCTRSCSCQSKIPPITKSSGPETFPFIIFHLSCPIPRNRLALKVEQWLFIVRLCWTRWRKMPKDL